MSSEALPAQTSMGFGGKLIAIIVKPKAVFSQIYEQSSKAWIFLALISLVLVALPLVVSGPLQRAQLIADFEETRGEFELPEGQPDPTQFIANPITTTVIPAVGAVFAVLFGWLIWSGALHLISSLTGGRNSFLQMLRLVIWSWVPYGLRAILQTIYIATTNTLIQNPGLSGLVDSGVSPDNPFATPSPGILAVQTFLREIDVYLFWRLGLLIVGVAIVAQLPRRKAIIAVLLVWGIFILLRVGAGAAVGGIAGGLAG